MRRLVKTEEEIKNIKYSSQVLGELLVNLKDIIQEGTTLIEIDKYCEEFILSHHGKPAFKGFRGYPNAACISVNENVIHGIPTNYKLKSGDIVGVDVGMVKNGGYGDTAYTYKIGELDDRTQKLLEVTEKSLYLGIDQAIQGNRVGDISNAIQKYVESEKFTLVKEYCGHGVGLDVWEEPSIPNIGPPNKGPRLKAGMVIAIEPMVNMGVPDVVLQKDGWTVTTKDRKPSCHYEHTILIRNGSPEILTKVD